MKKSIFESADKEMLVSIVYYLGDIKKIEEKNSTILQLILILSLINTILLIIL